MMEMTSQFLLIIHLVASVTITATTARFVFAGHRSNYHKDKVCRNGMYGKHCDRECLKENHCRTHCPHCVSVRCSGSGRCSRTCSSGYYGTRCSQECPGVRCISCHQSLNVCTSCQKGYHGIRCQDRCGRGCSEGSCSQNGDCLCKNWFYGDFCNQTCPINCHQSSESNEVPTCDHHSGVCNHGCKMGWTGKWCYRPCSSECIGGACDRTGDCVSGCTSFTYGSRCENSCSSNCLQAACDQEISNMVRCTHGCVDGWWGQNCQDRCPPNCKTCNRTTGFCTNCNEHLFGHMCDKSCSDKCRMSQCSLTGTCTHGCSDGFHQLDCSAECGPNCRRCRREDGVCTVCKDGFYGYLCNHTCPINCQLSSCNDTTCDQQSGVCNQGCRTGWFSGHCDQPCSSGCEGRLCHQVDGSCIYSCTTGYYLLNCSKKCHTYCRRCRHEDGVCIQCEDGRSGKNCTGPVSPGSSLAYVALLLFGLLSSVALFLLGFCVAISRRKMKTSYRSEVVYLNAEYSHASPAQDGNMRYEEDEHIYEEITEPEREPLYATVQKSQGSVPQHDSNVTIL